MIRYSYESKAGREERVSSGSGLQLMPKELSWLSFNGRVLQEAADPSVPLIERLRYLGIYSNNQDEFFKVRVADLKRQIIIRAERGTEYDENVNLLRQVQNLANKYQLTLNDLYDSLLRELAGQQIYLRDEQQIDETQRAWVRDYFRREVLKHINPVIIGEKTDLVSFLKDAFTYLLVCISRRSDKQYALIEIPTDAVPRFVRVPGSGDGITLMFLDNVIRIGLDLIFKGLFSYSSIEAYSIKLNRDAEYDLAESMDKSVLENMSESLKQRLNAMPVRFAYDAAMPRNIVSFMAKKLRMSSIDSMMPGARYHNFKDFMSFPGLGRAELENAPMAPVSCTAFDQAANPFEAIAAGDVLLYYPYYRFDYFTEFLRQASYDPAVVSIKINIYRVAAHSLVINSLIDAANNGKSVTVVVELKARFDEANNIKWASRLTDAGVRVMFGLPTLKIHSKLCLVTRHEEGGIRRYAHIGTGNFNEKTARIYTDFALFTVNPEISDEVEQVFSFIEYPYTRPKFTHLLVSPLNARERLTALIDREIQNAKAGKPCGIRLKVNNLVDKKMIARLCDASRAGVPVRAVVRGMCSLLPGVSGMSENIYITSIVDRFLEHPRVMIFCNGGNEEVYISSADWMTRNLDYRIEVGTQILSPVLRRRISNILKLQEDDSCKARVIDKMQTNVYAVAQDKKVRIRSQIAIRDYLQSVESQLGGGERAQGN